MKRPFALRLNCYLRGSANAVCCDPCDSKCTHETRCQCQYRGDYETEARGSVDPGGGEEHGHDQSARRLARQSRCSLHASCGGTSFARSGEKHIPVVGHLKEPETEATQDGQQHKLDRVTFEWRERDSRQPGGKKRTTRGTQPRCGDSVDQPPSGGAAIATVRGQGVMYSLVIQVLSPNPCCSWNGSATMPATTPEKQRSDAITEVRKDVSRRRSSGISGTIFDDSLRSNPTNSATEVAKNSTDLTGFVEINSAPRTNAAKTPAFSVTLSRSS